MTPKFRDKKQIARRRRITRTIIGFVIFVALATVGLMSWSGGFFHRIGRPIWKAENAMTENTSRAASLVRTKSSIIRENDGLRRDNAALRADMLDYQIVKNENDQLKELMGRVPEVSNLTLATILTKPNRSPYDTIIIDTGSDVGLSEGDRVYANGDIPLGEISKVYARTSLVTLYSNPEYTTDALLDGSNASVELVGRGGGNFEMTIPLDLPSQKGGFVVFPGTPMHIVAIIEDVISVPTDPVKRVILRSPVNIQNLKWVQVKKNQ